MSGVCVSSKTRLSTSNAYALVWFADDKVAAKACKYLEDVALVGGEHNHRHSYHLCPSSGSRWLVGNTIIDRR